MSQTLNNGKTTSLLFQQISNVNSLYKAWRKVRANRGAPGSDAISILAFEKDLQRNLAELSRNLLNHSYEPLPIRSVTIPKSNGSARELAIPTVRDRIAQRAVLDAIEPGFESKFLDCSYAFRPGRSVEMAIQKIIVARAQGYLWTVESDIKNFFPSIDHNLLIEELTSVIADKDVLSLIGQWMKAGILEQEPSRINTWLNSCYTSLATAKLAIQDTIESLADEHSEHSEQTNYLNANRNIVDDEIDVLDTTNLQTATQFREEFTAPEKQKSLIRSLVENGIIISLAQRVILGRFLTLPILGIGGAAIAGAVAVPYILKKLQKNNVLNGTPQGSPISPFLSNAYLHPFDIGMIEKGYRLIRYCDDFVVLCRTKTEANAALQAAKKLLGERKLQLHPEKTRLVSPTESFAFLGYGFTGDGSLIIPPSIPKVVADKMLNAANQSKELAQNSFEQTTNLGKTTVNTTKRRLGNLLNRLATKLQE